MIRHVALMHSKGSQGQSAGGRVEMKRDSERVECAKDTQPAPNSHCPWSAQRRCSVNLQLTIPLGAHEKCFNFFENRKKNEL